jgi:DNA-binding winged helix-turn-helix (wHTH) protein
LGGWRNFASRIVEGAAMDAAGANDLMVGGFRLSVRDRALWDVAGRRVLKSRAFDLLLALIEARDRVVAKADLMRQVWGDIFVEENNLHVQIAAIRRALGAEGRCILTVPGKGYRFIGQLRSGPGRRTVADDAAEPAVRLAAATARFWLEAGLAGEARTWLDGVLDRDPTPAQVDMLARLQTNLADLSREPAMAENSSIG